MAHALRAEHSFRTQALAAGGVLVFMLWLRPAPVWWALVTLTSGAVLAAELFNTALEHLADHLHPEQHPSIKIVKDLGAAAVLILSIGAIGVAAALLLDAFAGSLPRPTQCSGIEKPSITPPSAVGATEKTCSSAPPLRRSMVNRAVAKPSAAPATTSEAQCAL